ncbi:MAG: hypothetical protein HYX86_02995 [Chloroflexi bacterium]|nr:hypothetical protein [Chloroflexota bacterium]
MRNRRFILLATLLAILALFFSLREPLRLTLREWTGEEDLLEGIKGSVALLILNLTRPPLNTADLVPVANTGVNPYGVNTFLEQEVEEEKIRHSLEMIAAAGFRWIRQEFPWEDIEIHGKGDFQDRRTTPYKSAWEKYDRIVALAAEYGIEIIARLDQPPAWALAQEKPEGVIQALPQDLTDFGDFVYALVSRYQGKIRYWQIWNEPNLYVEWGSDPDPAAYVELLRVAYQRAKEADPEAEIISAALSPTTEMGPRNLSDLVYLQGMYEAGARDYFDILAAQAFGLWTGPTDRRTNPSRTNFSRLLLLREIMVESGDENKPIWITEFGWNAAPPDMEAPWGRVSLENQADYAVQGYLRVQREWPWVGVVNYWFFKRASEAEQNQPFYYFRLAEPDFTPLPVYSSVSQLANDEPFVGAGYHSAEHWALHWEGGWTKISTDSGDYLLSTTPEDSLSFDFWGTDLKLVIAEQNSGAIQVSVDGTASQIDLSSPQANGEKEIMIATGLADTRHTVKITTLPRQGGSEVAIAGLIVTSRPFNPWLLVDLILVVVFLASAFYVIRRRWT